MIKKFKKIGLGVVAGIFMLGTSTFAADDQVAVHEINSEASIITVSDDVSIRFSAGAVPSPSTLNTSAVAGFGSEKSLDGNMYGESANPVYYKLTLQDSTGNPVNVADVSNILTMNNSGGLENPIILKYSKKDGFKEIKFDTVVGKLYGSISGDISGVYSVVNKIGDGSINKPIIEKSLGEENNENLSQIEEPVLFDTQSETKGVKENIVFLIFIMGVFGILYFTRRIKNS